jgi:rfaE bifunctional protein nucleotidyltransferase chain/domain
MIISQRSLLFICEELRSFYKKIVFTNGCFDLIHVGHVAYLNEARKLGDILIIGLNSNDSVRRLKGNSRPINDEWDRAIVLDALKPVDYVVIFDEDTPYELIQLIEPDYLVKGGDYSFEDIVGADIVQQKGGEVVVIPFIEGKSTTKIIEQLVASTKKCKIRCSKY